MNKTTLKDWIANNEPAERMFFAGPAKKQFVFLSDDIAKALYDDETTAERSMLVVSTHTSKSIRLPVVEAWLTVRDRHAARIVLRGNFYDWKVSVDARAPAYLDSEGLFDVGREFSSCYCEGFPDGDVFGGYRAPSSRFTIEIADGDDLIEFVRRLKRALAEALQ